MNTIVVPVKNLAGAKQRLAEVLTAEQRRSLAEAMLRDVLEALAQLEQPESISIVTGDAVATALAGDYGFDIIADHEDFGETAAIALATDVTASGGSDGVLVIPADVPLITAVEIKAILDAAPESGTVLVAAADGRGTNAILRRPPSLFPARFGNDSFLPHLESARRAGFPVVILELSGVALDVDRPDDLAALLAAGGSTRTQNLLRSWQAIEAAHSSPCR